MHRDRIARKGVDGDQIVILGRLPFEGETPLWPERSVVDKGAVSLELAVMAFPILGLVLAQQAILVRYYLD